MLSVACCESLWNVDKSLTFEEEYTVRWFKESGWFYFMVLLLLTKPTRL